MKIILFLSLNHQGGNTRTGFLWKCCFQQLPVCRIEMTAIGAGLEGGYTMTPLRRGRALFTVKLHQTMSPGSDTPSASKLTISSKQNMVGR